MKRVTCAVLALILMLSCAALTGCGSGGEQPSAEPDVNTVIEEMRAASELPQMLSMNSGDERGERGFAAVSDLDYEKVEAYSLLYAADGSAYEIAVIRLKDAADSAALEQSLRRHIENRVRTYRQYSPEELPRAESAAAAVHGRYAALVMCDDVAAVKAIFDKVFE